jgi:hypothetical protein
VPFAHVFSKVSEHHTCDPSTQEAEDHEFKASLGFTARPCLRRRTFKKQTNKQTNKEA